MLQRRDGAFEWDFGGQIEPQVDTSEIERLHRVFKQNPEGGRILEDWIKRFALTPKLDMEPGLYKAGFLDGQANLPKMILAAIESVENE